MWLENNAMLAISNYTKVMVFSISFYTLMIKVRSTDVFHSFIGWVGLGLNWSGCCALVQLVVKLGLVLCLVKHESFLFWHFAHRFNFSFSMGRGFWFADIKFIEGDNQLRFWCLLNVTHCITRDNAKRKLIKKKLHMVHKQHDISHIYGPTAITKV